MNSRGGLRVGADRAGDPAASISILGVLPPEEAGYSNITDLYVARYGKPAAGTRIFIRTRQVLNGWEDVPKQATAIVPTS